LQKTIELVEKTTDRVDKVLMGEAKRMEKSLLAADGKSGVVEGVEKEKSAQTGSDEGEEGEMEMKMRTRMRPTSRAGDYFIYFKKEQL